MRKTVAMLLNGFAVVTIAFIVVVTLINIGVIRQGGEYVSFGK